MNYNNFEIIYDSNYDGFLTPDSYIQGFEHERVMSDSLNLKINKGTDYSTLGFGDLPRNELTFNNNLAIYKEDVFIISWDMISDVHNQVEKCDNKYIFAQFHQQTNSGSPVFAIGVDKNKIYYESCTVANCSEKNSNRKISENICDIDKYSSWSIIFKSSTTKNGFVQVYKNNRQIVDFRGFTMYENDQYNYFKLGLYKWNWQVKPSNCNHHELIFDNIKIQKHVQNWYKNNVDSVFVLCYNACKKKNISCFKHRKITWLLQVE